ncbi:alpha/beta hydrolase [Fructobacillus sp. M158]|uniref:alpha/beta fold hydrolase n=1 Tax=Fructobacillus parabroussonetiae TaxID=2713174 RepID=UPI00200A163D|nr:alpha/beta hydrolase [Fructobacillus parabroussonetiae]MCK8617608.1 alpha/beta hydrolase [Fructobacillus parabroussonetiae]
MLFKRIQVKGVSIFYRTAGDPKKPALLLLHGFPTASHYFRQLMPLLAKDFYCVAPDMVGFGQSESPDRRDFTYSFENETAVIAAFLKALAIDQYYLYVFDYGAPVGFRLAMAAPEKILGIISQNGNVYEEGLGSKWQARKAYWQQPTAEGRATFAKAYDPKTIKAQYLGGEQPGTVGPDGYCLDIFYRETIADFAEKQNDLILDYRSNVAAYPDFQRYLRDWQPKLLAIWGQNDPSFIWPGALAFQRDVPNAKVVALNAGHFALESQAQTIAKEIISTFIEERKRNAL